MSTLKPIKPRIILPPNKRIKSPKDYDRKREKKVGDEDVWIYLRIFLYCLVSYLDVYFH